MCLSWSGVAATPASAGEPTTTVTIDPADRQGAVPRLVFGANHRYPYGGSSIWDAENDRTDPGFLGKFVDSGITATRYPGGIPSEGSVITVSYTSGPHDGFVDFYKAMKAADPDINVCSAYNPLDYQFALGGARQGVDRHADDRGGDPSLHLHLPRALGHRDQAGRRGGHRSAADADLVVATTGCDS